MDRLTIRKWIDVCQFATRLGFSVTLEGEGFVLRWPGGRQVGPGLRVYHEQVAEFDNLIAVAAYLRGWDEREKCKAI
jgi:hypothetical protein